MFTKVEGLVIRTKDYGEGNKILVLYTQELGKISVMARGAKKPKSRLSSVSQPFTRGLYLFYKGSGGMGTLSQGEILQSFRALRQDLFQASHASYFVDLVDKLTEEHEKNTYLYQLLVETLQFLEDGKDADILTRLFELKLLHIGGYRPELNQCVICSRTDGDFGFSVVEGGLICERCKTRDPEHIRLSVGARKVLRTLYLIQPHQLGDIRVKAETRKELQQVIWTFMDMHTPLRLKTRDFLQKLNNFIEPER